MHVKCVLQREKAFLRDSKLRWDVWEECSLKYPQVDGKAGRSSS